MSTEDLLTPEEAANQLDVSTRTLANWRASGAHELPYLKIGKQIRYRQEDIDELLEELEETEEEDDSEDSDEEQDD